MKTHSLPFISVFIALLIIFPTLALAATPSSTSPYFTDTVNNYVQDQVSKDMDDLNGFLCMISAMAPNLMVNEPDYIAMINLKTCRPNTQNNNNNNTGSSFLAVQLNSTRTSNTSPMNVKIWLDDYVDELTNTTLKVPMYASASQAPSKTLPYGVFRLDYCKQFASDTNCNKHVGYIDATTKGLAFYTKDYKIGQYGEYYDEFALKLGASTTTNTGSGIVIKTNTNNSTGDEATSAIVFAHNSDFFYRDDNVNPPQCFDRSSSKADESVWRYGLYYSADTGTAKAGDRFEHQSNYTIKYTDANNKSYWGYIGYYGYWFPYDANISSGANVYKVDYATYPPTEKQYTFLKSGGKLTKYSTFFLKLSDLHKSPFSFYLSSAAATAGGAGISPMISGDYYYIYWNKDTQLFYVYSHYNNLTYKYDILPYPVSLTTASFVAAVRTTTFGLNGDAPILGGSFKIQDGDIASLATTLNDTRVITQTQDVVYPKDYAALNASGGLKCIADCPTLAQIGLYNADQALTTPTNTVSPFVNKETYIYNPTTYEYIPTAGYGYNTLKTYYLDPASGNLREGAPPVTLPGSGSQVIQTAFNYVPQSGKMITKTDLIAFLVRFGASDSSCSISNCTMYQSYIDYLAYVNDPATGLPRTSYSYYEWSTGAYSWDQMAFLIDGATTLEFFPPLPVTFTAPTTTQYGNNAGRTVGLDYAEFGNLWGIPYKCVDLRNNLDCVYYDPAIPTWDPVLSLTKLITPYDKRYYAAEYSIPFDETLGVVTTARTQGSVVKGTNFLVKALEKETRLTRVPIGICTVQGLGQNISVDKLPSADQWKNPATIIGTKSVLNPLPAPRVIHGVKQY